MTEKIKIASISPDKENRRLLEAALSHYKLNSTNLGSSLELFAYDNYDEAFAELSQMIGLSALILDVSNSEEESELFQVAIDLLEHGLQVELLIVASCFAHSFNDERVVNRVAEVLGQVSGDVPIFDVHRRPVNFKELNRALKSQRGE